MDLPLICSLFRILYKILMPRLSNQSLNLLIYTKLPNIERLSRNYYRITKIRNHIIHISCIQLTDMVSYKFHMFHWNFSLKFLKSINKYSRYLIYFKTQLKFINPISPQKFNIFQWKNSLIKLKSYGMKSLILVMSEQLKERNSFIF